MHNSVYLVNWNCRIDRGEDNPRLNRYIALMTDMAVAEGVKNAAELN